MQLEDGRGGEDDKHESETRGRRRNETTNQEERKEATKYVDKNSCVRKGPPKSTVILELLYKKFQYDVPLCFLVIPKVTSIC